MSTLPAPAFGPIGKEVFERTYSRVKENGENETWEDTVRRVVKGNTELVESRFIEPNEQEKLFDLIYNFKMVPAGRHLWVSGVEGRQFVANCFRSPFSKKLSEHYTFTFNELMKGGGVGANYSNRYIDQVQPILNKIEVNVTCNPENSDYNEMNDRGLLSDKVSYMWDGCYDVEDSREGWVDTLDHIFAAATDDTYTDGETVKLSINVSNVRPKGARIRGFGGIASGPLALAEMLTMIQDITNNAVGRKLTTLEHMQIDHRIAMCVIAGNTRRSARMAIKSWSDDDVFDFIECKKDWSEHWSTNISVEIGDEFISALKRKKHPMHDHATKVYQACVAGMLENGEPGFYNSDLASVGETGDVCGTNPCSEITLEEYESCLLGHVNVSKFYDNFDGGAEAFRLMTRFLVRATFAEKSNKEQEEVVNKNRRIGVGFFGFQGWLNKQNILYSECASNRYVRKTLRDWKKVVDKEADRYAHMLRIPSPIKRTTLAPTGSISQLSGDSASAQTIYSPYFKRRVRYADNSEHLTQFEGTHEIEDCLYTSNTKVVTMYVKDPLVAEVEALGLDPDIVEGADDLSISDMLGVQAMLQECYVDNAISFTINVAPDFRQEQNVKQQIADGVDEALIKIGPPDDETVEEVMDTMLHYLPHLKGTTIMVDGSRPQAPLERISKGEFESHELAKELGQGELACSVNGCPVK